MWRRVSILMATLATTPALAAASLPPFDAEAPPPAPDYARAANWAATGASEGAAARTPPNAERRASARIVDVFYIHPTTYRDDSHWNQPLDDAATNASTDRSVVARQASAFNACCRIFAPRYRQATLAAFASVNGDGAKAYALAFTDVLNAFDHYIAYANHGRRFIIVGHSQGALHGFNLLRARIDGTPLARRMVAAYLFGYGITLGDFGTTLPTLKPCSTLRQTGCVIGWNSFLEGSDATGYAARARQRYVAVHGTGTAARLLCSDPLALGGRRRARGLGSLPESDADEPPPLVPDAVVSRCDADGVLKVALAKGVEFAPLPGGSLHYHDIALFYADLRADALRRSAAR